MNACFVEHTSNTVCHVLRCYRRPSSLFNLNLTKRPLNLQAKLDCGTAQEYKTLYKHQPETARTPYQVFCNSPSCRKSTFWRRRVDLWVSFSNKYERSRPDLRMELYPWFLIQGILVFGLDLRRSSAFVLMNPLSRGVISWLRGGVGLFQLSDQPQGRLVWTSQGFSDELGPGLARLAADRSIAGIDWRYWSRVGEL